ncbi:hypothetical protein [Curtobacterium sp. MCBA15_012]|uniref:hypothetical protein n=1 Tax=Curtobacterium sp. MCBA15_012 TaxID=1898738 RepID=UPI0011140B96|nr:hypothetical protein [Curtobacterium sp. MCBA15_012]WIA99591.1 hypothetical protein QOL15_13860 [Curtobacterium sp. MCBA15_012]
MTDVRVAAVGGTSGGLRAHPSRPRLRGAIVTVLAATVLATTGCASGGAGCVPGQDARDAAGTTQAQGADRSLQDEFELAGERYEHGQALLAAAQRRISDGTWYWNGGDVRPLPAGDDAFGTAPEGATRENSYAFRAVRIIEPEGATGAVQDLEPMQRYFDEEGWRWSSAKVGTDHEVRADTGDGWWVTWNVRPNGQYSLGVYSEAFWAHDAPGLIEAIALRDPADFPDASEPGVSEPFPNWSDPVRQR